MDEVFPFLPYQEPDGRLLVSSVNDISLGDLYQMLRKNAAMSSEGRIVGLLADIARRDCQGVVGGAQKTGAE